MKYETAEAEEIENVSYFKEAVITNNSIQSLKFDYDGVSYLLTSDYNGIRLSKNSDHLINVFVVSGYYTTKNSSTKVSIREVVFESERDASLFVSDIKDSGTKHNLTVYKAHKNAITGGINIGKKAEVIDTNIPF